MVKLDPTLKTSKNIVHCSDVWILFLFMIKKK